MDYYSKCTCSLKQSLGVNTVFNWNPSLVVACFIKTNFSLLNHESQLERDKALLLIHSFVKDLNNSFRIDASDPSSGHPLIGDTTSSLILADVDVCLAITAFESFHVDGCRMILHPKWRDCSYPFVLVTSVDFSILEPHLIKFQGLVEQEMKTCFC